MEDLLEINMLMDFYGQLLTENQRKIMDMHYYKDYTFAEIAESLGITRQGVYEIIKRSKQILKENEEKMKLIERFGFIKQKSVEIVKILEDIEKNVFNENVKEIKKQDALNKLSNIKIMLDQIIEA